MRQRYGFFMFLFCGLIACQRPTSPDPIEISFDIQDEGLSFLTIGQPMAWLDSLSLPYIVSEVAYSQEDGYIWPIREMQVDTGKVIFEGEFLDEKKSSVEALQQSLVSRIRIESPQFSHKGVKMGMSLNELLALAGDREIEATYIPGFQVIDVLIPSFSQAHFLFACPTEVSFNTDEVYFIPQDSLEVAGPIHAIVLL